MNLIHTDILKWADQYQGEPLHALLTDPPYELEFMGRNWDNTGVSFRPETWAALARHLHPGAFGMAFASTRGWHRMAVAIEDAGLIIHPTIFCWSFGSGFPKATRIDTQLDRAAGAEREVVGQRPHAPKFAAKDFGYREKDNGFNSRERESFAVTAPATPEAAAWAGHRYGLQALKPALEPIIVFQKPYQGRPVECIARTGAGALNIDGGRIGTIGGGWNGLGNTHDETQWRLNNPDGVQRNDGGRWPANLALVHHPACTDSHCDAACPVRLLGEQSGESASSNHTRNNTPSGVNKTHSYGRSKENWTTTGVEDIGTAARFFYNADWMLERLEAADPVGYYAKASTAEREAGLESFAPTTVDDGRQTPIDNPYLRGETTRRNVHPTIKPISLARWLATLLLPPDLYAPRRLLVPFAGVGSEMVGALLAGWEDVTGLEREADHVEIGRARLAWWSRQAARLGTSDPETVLAHRDEPEGLTLFDLLGDVI